MAGLSHPQRVYKPVPAHSLDEDVVKVVRRLRRYDHEAYLVGGCVRDLLLGVRPKDFDVATGAKPREVRRVFRNSRVIGRRFQLVHVLFRDQKIIEVATFRQPPAANPPGSDGDDADLLITDDNVFGTASDDAFRRDFTINALFYDVHTREIVDFVSGLDDIEARLVRSIGDPDVRLREDPVRMLRAIKFASRLNLKIEAELWRSIRRHREEINKAAPPRLLEEIYRLFRPGVSVAAFRLLREAGLWSILLPQVAAHLSEAGEEGVQEYESVLASLDEIWEMRKASPPDAQVLMALLWTPWKAALKKAESEAEAEDKRLDMGATLQDFLTPWMTGLRVPRRIQDRIRQVWMAQSRFEPGANRSRGGRRRKSDAFLRRSFFEEAVDFYEICVRAAGGDLVPVDSWRARADLKQLPDSAGRYGKDGPPARVSPAPAADGDGRADDGDDAPKRRRRRRRRRRGGGEGGDEGSTGGGDGPAAAAS